MKEKTKRQERIEKLLLEEFAKIFLSHTNTLFNNTMVTVTKVNVTRDFLLARVNISVFPSEKVEEIMKILETQNNIIKRDLGNGLRNHLRRIPEIEYYIDDSLDYIDRIDELLKK